MRRIAPPATMHLAWAMATQGSRSTHRPRCWPAARMPWAVDEYLLWAISEGGTPFATKMPAFMDTLTREQIWQIITYMRAGFPAINETGRE